MPIILRVQPFCKEYFDNSHVNEVQTDPHQIRVKNAENNVLTSRQMERLTFLIHYILRTIIIIHAIQRSINDLTLHLHNSSHYSSSFGSKSTQCSGRKLVIMLA